jgi:hypothetical protein
MMTNKEEMNGADGKTCGTCGEALAKVASYCDGCETFTERRSQNRPPELFFDMLAAALGALDRDAKTYVYKLVPRLRPGSGERDRGPWTRRDADLAKAIAAASSHLAKSVEALRAVEGQLRLYR